MRITKFDGAGFSLWREIILALAASECEDSIKNETVNS